MAMTKGLFHVFLASTDLERTIKFYLDSFEGARIAYQFTIFGGELCMLDLGNGIELEIGKVDGYHETSQSERWEHIAIECTDIQGQYNRMVAAGARVRVPMHEDVLTGINGHPNTHCSGAFLYGPDDEVIELCHTEIEWPWRA